MIFRNDMVTAKNGRISSVFDSVDTARVPVSVYHYSNKNKYNVHNHGYHSTRVDNSDHKVDVIRKVVELNVK